MSEETEERPPCDYVLRLDSYSNFLESMENKKYEYDFKALDRNWALVFYPTGNKERNGKGYISLYLKMVGSGNDECHRYCSILVNFSFYVFDHHKARKYVSFPESVGMVKKFDDECCEWGCDRFLKLTSSSGEHGYINDDDSCMFGVEIFHIKPTRAMEILSILTYSWKIDNFQSKAGERCINSEEFERGGRKWNLSFYPKGRTEENDHASVYLVLNDVNGTPVDVAFTVHVTVEREGEQRGGKHSKNTTRKFESSSCSRGWPKFMPVQDLAENVDTVTIAAEFSRMSMVKIN